MITQDRFSHLTQWNPLRGLKVAELISRIEEGERGDYTRLQWTYRAVERRNATVRAIKLKLLSALAQLDWDIKVRSDLPPEKEAAAEQQKATLRAAYERIRNLRAALVHLALADFRGFAHVETIFAPDHTITELRPVPQWHFKRNGALSREWRYDPDARFGESHGTPVEAGRMIVREVDDPASEIFAVCHLDCALADADWSGFLEKYGIPSTFIIGPPNVPPAKEKEYQNTAEAITGDGGGYLPNGSDVKDVDAPTGHSEVFETRLRWLQECMVLAGTGGILTMLASPTGIGQGASSAHGDTWLDVAAAVASRVSEALQAQFDLPLLQKAFGPETEPLAYFELAKPSEEDVAAHVTNAKMLGEAGYEIQLAELSEKTGYTITRKLPPANSPSSALPVSPARAGDAPADDAAPAAVPASAPNADGVASSGNPAPPADNPEGVAPIRTAANPRPSQSATAKPSIVQSALAESMDVDAKTFAPIKPLLDALERLLASKAEPAVILDQIEATIAALPDLLTSLDTEALANALEAAAGPAAVQGVRDALAARRK